MTATAVPSHTDSPAQWASGNLRPSVNRPRLLLADDHGVLLDALRSLLEREFTVLPGVSDGEALVKAALEHRPDVVLCDVSMPRLSGLQAAERIRARLPRVRFVFLTMHDDPELAAEAFRVGAAAYMLKSSPASDCCAPFAPFSPAALVAAHCTPLSRAIGGLPTWQRLHSSRLGAARCFGWWPPAVL